MLRYIHDGLRLKRLSPRGIVFDMDGVLLASSPIHEAAYRSALRGYDIPHFRYPNLASMRTRDGILTVLTEHNIAFSDDLVEKLAVAKSRLALAGIKTQNPIVPGARNVLVAMSQRFKLALASSGSEESVTAFLFLNDLRSLFHCTLHSGDVQHAKPSPEIFEAAILRLGLKPTDCLVVEDAVAGIQAAKAAGAVACGIPTTCTENELEQAGADLLIDRLEDLLEIGTPK